MQNTNKKTTNKVFKAIGKSAGMVLLVCYLLVAVINSSIVQSFLGAAASRYFTKEWGGKVRIGALHASPFSHLIVDKIELISPTDDTIYVGDRITCRFKRFPYRDNHLCLDRVSVRNGRYHLETFFYPNGRPGINLDYIIRYFSQGTPPPPAGAGHFVVEVGEVRLHNVDYIQDIPEHPGYVRHPHGVDIPHMRFYGTSACLRRVRVNNDSITCRIVSLSTTEASGLRVIDLSADAEVSPHVIRATNLDLQTANSRVFLDGELTFHGWNAMKDYCNNVKHKLILKEGTLANLCDAAYWAPDLWGIDVLVAAQGHAYGTIADLHADNMFVAFGRDSRALVNGSVTGLPDISKTHFDVLVNRLHTNYEDLAAVRHPDGIKMHFPELLQQMGVIDIDAWLQGHAYDCQAFANINSEIGDLEVQASIRYDAAAHDYAYAGSIDSRTIGIRPILPNEWVTRTGLHFDFQGTGFHPERMDASLEGRLYNTVFKGAALKRTSISADINNQMAYVDIVLNDTLVGLDIEAAANLRERTATANIALDNVHLTKLGLLQSDSNILLSSVITASLSGSDLDDHSGTVSLQGTHVDFGGRHIDLDRLDISATSSQGKKVVRVSNDWFTADLNGYIQYDHLPRITRDFCNRYVPAYFNPFCDTGSLSTTDPVHDHFEFDLVWNDAGNSFQQVVPGIYIAPGTSFHGNYSHGEMLKTVLRSDLMAYDGISMEDIGLNSTPMGENYQLSLHAGTLSVGEVTFTNNMDISASLGTDISTLRLHWDNNSTAQNKGDLEFFLHSTATDNKLMVSRPSFFMAGRPWSLVCPQGIAFNRNRLQVDNMSVYSQGQSITLNALMRQHDDDYIKATFNNFAPDHLIGLIIPHRLVDLSARMNGDLFIRWQEARPYFDADLTVEDLVLNGHRTDRIRISTGYEASENKMRVSLLAEQHTDSLLRHPVTADGTITLDPKNPLIDFGIGIDGVSLNILLPFVKDFASDIGGTLDGTLTVGGTLTSPMVDGTLDVGNGMLALSLTGVSYYFNNEITVSNNSLRLRDFLFHDRLGNALTADGSMSLDRGRPAIDLDFSTPGLLVLDKDNSSAHDFYGSLLVSADGRISGPIDSISITAAATTLKNSRLFVPIDNSRQAWENNQFITFISNTPTSVPRRYAPPKRNKNSHFNMLLNIAVTPGMRLELPMDFDQLDVVVNAVGQGDIQVSLHDNNPPDILGNYEFMSGNFKMSLMQLVSKNFEIEEGSTLNFPGSIDDARFNINAVYNLRTNLASLMSNAVSSASNDVYVQVQDVITLSGSLQDPSIKFDIRLPNADPSVSEQVFSYIDKNNELDMLNQSISLLLLNSFASAGTNNAGDEAGFNSISMITNTAGSIVSSMIKFVDVDFNYQAATGSSLEQFDIGISKHWNNLYFESSFGYSNNGLQVEQNNTLVGDVEIGYRFTPFFGFYGFNRTNTSYYTRTDLPYKQGLGIKLSKDFDSLYDLFPWLRKNKKKIASPAK